MSIRTRTHWQSGERAIGLFPGSDRSADQQTVRRTRFAAGRSLTPGALTLEQNHRDQRFDLMANSLTPGVVSGLEVSADLVSTGDADNDLLTVFSGQGICPGGQELSLPSAVSFAPHDIPISGVGNVALLPEGDYVLRLVPVRIQISNEPDRTSEKESSVFLPIDPDDYPYTNRTLSDAVRIEWYGLNKTADAGSGDASKRNKLASRLLASTDWAKLEPRKVDWWGNSVPIAAVNVAADGKLSFLDQYSVVRTGGLRPPRQSLIPSSGDLLTRQAAFYQFIEHATDILVSGGSLNVNADEFSRVPAAGLLPRSLFDHKSMKLGFFPSNYMTWASPIPEDQLERALEESIPLAPFELSQWDAVEVLVPVPDELFDPQLLYQEKLSPLYDQTIEETKSLYQKISKQEDVVLAQGKFVVGTIDFSSIEKRFKTGESGDGEFKTETVAIVTDLHSTVKKINVEEDGHIQPGKIGDVEFSGVAPFIEQLEQLVSTSNDSIDAGFVRLQADIYRIRQNLLGAEDATRLATSPVLAGIAKGDSSYATTKQIDQYLVQLKGLKDQPRSDSSAIPSVSTERVDAVMDTTPIMFGSSIADTPQPERFSLSTQPIFFDPNTFVVPGPMEIAPTTDYRVDLYSSTYLQPINLVEPKKQAVATPTEIDTIRFQSPLAPAPFDVRTITVAERLVSPAAHEAKKYAVAGKAKLIGQLQLLGISLQGLSLPLATRRLRAYAWSVYEPLYGTLSGENQKIVDEFAKRDPTGFYVNVNLSNLKVSNEIRDFLNKLNVLPQVNLDDESLESAIAAGAFDPNPSNPDEAIWLSSAIETLETAVSALRLVEARVGVYDTILAHSKKTYSKLISNREKWLDMLGQIEAMKLEAEHDLIVAQALKDEEQLRISEVNSRREDTLANHVKEIAFRRPRTAPTRLNTQGMELLDEFVSPLPACARANVQAPSDIAQMVGILREVPLKWLTVGRQVLEPIKTPGDLQYVLQNAKLRTIDYQPSPAPKAAVENNYEFRNAAVSVDQYHMAYHQQAHTYFVSRQKFDLSLLSGLGFLQTKELVLKNLALSDLIETGKISGSAAKRALDEVEAIERAAGCLFEHFSEVPAQMRLRWSQDVSFFDGATDLRNLNALAGWSDVDRSLRRDTQAIVDWLFSRVDFNERESAAYLSDLVRVCLLVASHAPVKDILTAHVPEPQKATIGALVPLRIDTGAAAIGMRTDFVEDGVRVAGGIVDDFINDQAIVRITETNQSSVTITQATTARIRRDTMPVPFNLVY